MEKKIIVVAMKSMFMVLVALLASISANANTTKSENYVKQFKKSARSERNFKKSDVKSAASDLAEPEEDFKNMCKSDEDQFMQVERSIVNPMIATMLDNKTELVANFI